MDAEMECSKVAEVGVSWEVFCDTTSRIVSYQQKSDVDFHSFNKNFVSSVNALIQLGLGYLVVDYFLQSLQERCKKLYVEPFWKQFDEFLNLDLSMDSDENKWLVTKWVEDTLYNSLDEICTAKNFQGKCLDFLNEIIKSSLRNVAQSSIKLKDNDMNLHSRYQIMLSALLLTSLPRHFPDILHIYFKSRLEEFTALAESKKNELNTMKCSEDKEISAVNSSSSCSLDAMDIDDLTFQSSNDEIYDVVDKTWISKIGHVLQNLKELGFMAMTEDAYSSAIFLLLNKKVHSLASEGHLQSVLEPIRSWIQMVPLHFLNIILPYLSLPFQDSNKDNPKNVSPLASSLYSAVPGKENLIERLTRWHLRLEYFAYETLQDLRINDLFDIIVDYPESEDAIKDLKQCLDNTGQHSKLVDSFLSSIRFRLLIAGASTNDILHQYISTIKALKILDPTGVFLQAVGQPIVEYLRERKDASKCVVAMLTESPATGVGEVSEGVSLLEELSKDAAIRESCDNNDYNNVEDEKAWAASESWEPDPVEADPSMSGRNKRSVDILGMLVGIFGSKEQLISEYCAMLADKLLSKLDYNVEHETRILELFKILFGEGSMQRCEIMVSDLIASKRTNTNIKNILKQKPKGNSCKPVKNALSLDAVDTTIVSSCFWPPFQAENIKVPAEIDELLSQYAEEYHVLKAPRKILWKKNLGAVKLELEFEDRSVDFVVSPILATIIMQFQEKPSWTSRDLSYVLDIPVDALCKKITFWVNQGVLLESAGLTSNEHVYTVIENIGDTNDPDTRAAGTAYLDEEDGETSEEEESKNTVVYEYFVKGMLTNFPSLKLEEIHKRLGDHSHGFYVYDLSLHQLQAFLSRLVSEDKLEVTDGEYTLRKS